MANHTVVRIQNQNSTSFKAIVRHNGRVLKTKTFKKMGDARPWGRKLESDLDKVTATGYKGAALSFQSVCEEYLSQWSGKDTTRQTRVMWWAERLGQYSLIEINSSLIRELRDEYLHGFVNKFASNSDPSKSKIVETAKRRSPAGANRLLAALSAVFKFARDRGYFNENPCSNVSSLTENSSNTGRMLEDYERKRLLEACKQSSYSQLYALVLMGLTTGARRGEILRLCWSDIDFSRREAYLSDTKNGSDRVIPLPEVTSAELARFREIGDGLVFPCDRGRGKAKNIRKDWETALRKARITNFRFHDLRHTAASMLVMGGATLHDTGEILGHRCAQTTKRYAHLSNDHKRSVSDSVFTKVFG
jgi:integrase